jgi:hypothetical protein
MDATQSTALPLPIRPARRRLRVAAVIAGLVIASYLGGLATGHVLSRGLTAPAPHPVRAAIVPRTAEATYAGPVSVTGTGPDLVEIAERSQAVRHVAVTGTGPGLVQIADYGGIGR